MRKSDSRWSQTKVHLEYMTESCGLEPQSDGWPQGLCRFWGIHMQSLLLRSALSTRRVYPSLCSLRRLALLLLFVMARLAMAQSGAGSIEGTVTDSSGAIIPGATIHVLNTATGVASDTTANKDGFYQVPGLFAGSYTVSAASGSLKFESTLTLLAEQDATVNAVLAPSAVTQQVTVTGNDVQLVDTTSGTLTATMENQQINQLPMNGRSFITLTQITTPGLEDGGQRVFGLNPETLEYVVDGITTTQVLNGGEHNGFTQLVDPDSVQEIRMVLNNGGAKYATPATGVVTIKSGTNYLHGTMFETARNNAIGIAKSRQDPADFVAPEYIRNEFGASAGGPVIIPHLYDGRNKTFWFFAYERYSLAQQAAGEFSVPTQAMRNGDFSNAVNSQGLLQTIYDPSTTYSTSKCEATGGKNPYCRLPFPNNTIPASEESPLAKVIYQLTPLPNSSANPLVAKNLNVTDPQYQATPQFTVRLDQTFNESNRMFVTYNQVTNATNYSSRLLNLAADGFVPGETGNYFSGPSWSHLGTIGYTHIFSPSFFSETVVGQQWFNTAFYTGVNSQTNFESLLNLPNNFGEGGFPSITGLVFSEAGSQIHDESDQIISNLDENLTKTLGKHQIQFGGRFRHVRESDTPQGFKDNDGFGVDPTAIYNPKSGQKYAQLPQTGFGDAGLFLGSAVNYSVNLSPSDNHYHTNEFDLYAQDNFFVTRNLTLNYGLRYEAHPALWLKYGLANVFDLNHDAVVLSGSQSQLIAEGFTTQPILTNDQLIGVKFETPAQAGLSSSLLSNSYLNFLPRVGFSWQPFDHHSVVVRGGYGKFAYPTPFADYINQSMKNNPFVATYSQSYTAANQAIDGLPHELLRYDGPVKFGVAGRNTAGVVNSTTTTAILPGLTNDSVTPSWQPTFAQEANLTVEQPFKDDSVLRVSYIFTYGSNLDVIDHYNNHPSSFQWEMGTGTIPPTGGASVIGTPLQNTYAATALGPYDQTTWGSGNVIRNQSGWSVYNALELGYQRIYHHGFGYQISYVYAKPMRAGGDQSASVYPYENYPGVIGSKGILSSPYGTIGYTPVAPPSLPSNQPDWKDYHAMDRYQVYQLDNTSPVQHVKANWVADIPIGRHELLFSNMNRYLNAVLGGFQIAGDFQMISQIFHAPTGSWGTTNPLHVYKHKYPIQDCRSGVCYNGYLWFNGFIPASQGTNCTSNCVNGLPGNYAPVQQPIDVDPTSPYYLTDTVNVKLSDGTSVVSTYDGGPQGASYLAKKWLNGPNNWNADLSIFKVVPIKGTMSLRFNVDAFNVFNVQGYNNPGGDGVELVQAGVGQASSYWTPRQIQLTARFTF